MDVSTISPSGMGCAVAHPQTLTPKQAMKQFEFFKPGTSRDVILLGDLVEQTVHYVRSKNHKVLCTAQLGTCQLCLVAPTSDDVSTAHAEFVAPAVVYQKKDRLFHQRVAVFTASMGETVVELTTGSPARGHRLEVARSSSQKFKIALHRQSPRALAHMLPEWFDLLPWVRARFGLPQSVDRPLVRVGPFSCRDSAGSLSRPKPLDLTPQDVQDVETVEARKAKLDEMRRKLESWKSPATEAPAPAAEMAEVAPAEKPGELKVMEVAADPANYAPKVRVDGGTGNIPTVTPAARRALQTNREAAERLKKIDAECREQEGKNSRDGTGQSNRLSGVSDAIDVLTANFPVPNGKHPAGKGGGK